MIQHINATQKRRIITIEDPIEYVFEDDQSIISQREVGLDTLSFHAALKHVLRQDPDVIMIGEMRDAGKLHGRARRRRDRPPGVHHAAHRQRRRSPSPAS